MLIKRDPMLSKLFENHPQKFDFDTSDDGCYGVFVDSNKKCVLKVFRNKQEKEYRHELKMLETLSSSVVPHSKLLHSGTYSSFLLCVPNIHYLVTEYVGLDGRELTNDHIQLTASTIMPEEMFIDATKQLAYALEHIHLSDIAHLDFKPENCAYKEGIWSIIDFGLSKALKPIPKKLCDMGTIPFICPILCKTQSELFHKVVANKNYTSASVYKRCDYFSFATSLLSFAGVDCTTTEVQLEGFEKPVNYVPIVQIRRILLKGVPGYGNIGNKLAKLLGKIVLANVYTDTEYITWVPRERNCVMHPNNSGEIHNFDVETLWQQLLYI